MTDMTLFQQVVTFIVTVTVPTAGACYFVVRLTIKGAIADFFEDLRKEFVAQNICTKTHELDNQRFDTLNEKLDRFEKQLEFFLNKKREI